MSYELNTINLPEGICVRIISDDDPVNPRRDYDPYGHMICWHSRYDLGDEHSYGDPTDFAIRLYNELAGDDYAAERLYRQSGESWEACQNVSSYELAARFEDKPDILWEKVHKLAVILPLYIYDHSGITMNTCGFSCGWDSGQVGYTYISLDEIRKEHSCKRVTAKIRANVERILKSEVKTYDQYLTGDVWGYVVENDDGDELDSCWGFFGDEDCKSEALRAAKSHVTDARKSRLNREIAEIKSNANRLRRSLTVTDTLAEFGRLGA